MTGIQALAYLNRVHPIAAPHKVAQKDGIAWLMRATARAAGENLNKRVERALDLYERFLKQNFLQYRSTVLGDYTHQHWEEMQLFRETERPDGSLAPWYAPPLERRMDIFASQSLLMTEKAFPEHTLSPSSIIEVSCTGYQAPYAAQQLLLKRQWQDQTRLLKLGHMGCYASVPALHLAAQLSQVPAKNIQREPFISIMSVELCTLHLRPHATDLDQMVANMLFADGAARLDVSATKSPQSLAILSSYESLIPDSAALMEWKLCDSSFSMVLSRGVSLKIAAGIKQHLDSFLLPLGLNWRDISRYAVHPGGPKIIDTIQEKLELADDAVGHSRTILAQHGNMSSSTLPHVWKAMQDDPKVKAGELIVSMAFGPGLTVAMNLLQKV